MTDTVCRIRFHAVTFGNMRPALAMRCRCVLRMHCGVARAVSAAYQLPEVEAVIARNFTPALSGLVRGDDVVKTLT